ncbi:MAG: TonB-dependent receptor domain-containing protein [Gemmatimonadales bacterium]
MTLYSRGFSRLGAWLAVFTLGAAITVAAQTGDIRGTITNAQTRAPVAGARVAVATPERVAITGEHGDYLLRALPAGRYTVFTTAVGRKPDTSSVTVSAGSAASHDVALAEGSLLLSSVVVSATRTAVDASKVASTVDVLTPEQVKQSPVREAQDLLREIPAIELPRTSSLVGSTAQIVSIRGVDEGRTAVLFDGIPVNDAWGEWIDWGRVPKSMLDHVEVVEGGTSSLYGNGAMGGLISFFSRPMAPGSADLQLDGGSRDARHFYGATGLPLARAFSLDVNGDYDEKGGYNVIAPDNRGPVDIVSNVIQRNAYARLNFAPSSDLSAFVTGHLFGDSRGLGTPLTFDNRDQRNLDFGADYQGLERGVLNVRAWDGRQLDNQRATAIRSATLRNAEDSSLTAGIPSHDWGASAMWSRNGLASGKLATVSFGGDVRHVQGDFNEVDFNTAGCPASPACGAVARAVQSGGNQVLSGAFAQAIVAPVDPLSVELSARIDQWSNNDGHSFDAGAGDVNYPDRNKTAFSPRLGVRYQLLSSFSLHGAVYKAFRAPNLAELYRKQLSATQVTIPNPNLDPETAVGREAGFDWQPIDWLQMKGTWYVADYNDFNVPVTLTTNKPADCGLIATCRERLNVSTSRSEGGEAYLALRPLQSLFVSAGVNYDDDRQQSGVASGTSSDDKPHINRVPSPRQTIRATWSSAMFGDWTAIWMHEGRTTTLGGIGLAPFTVVNANVDREIVPGVRGFISVENVGDVQYQVNIAGAGTAANPFIVSQGLPRTLRAGLEAFRF